MTLAVPATREAAALAISGLGSWISLHTASPGSTGASEAAGTTRRQTTWTAGPVDGTVTGSQVTHTAAPANTYTHYGIWSASTGGTFVDGNSLSPGSVTVSAATDILFTPTINVS